MQNKLVKHVYIPSMGIGWFIAIIKSYFIDLYHNFPSLNKVGGHRARKENHKYMPDNRKPRGRGGISLSKKVKYTPDSQLEHS